MATLKVERLTIQDISGEADYDSRTSTEPLFAEANSAMNEFKVILKAGTYSHVGDAAGNGAFEMKVATGQTFHGFIERSMPARTPDGVNTPPSLELVLRVE